MCVCVYNFILRLNIILPQMCKFFDFDLQPETEIFFKKATKEKLSSYIYTLGMNLSISMSAL